jgi:WD40 repeat protein
MEAMPKRQKAFEGHAQPASALAFSPDSKLLASCGADGKVIVWDVDSGKQLFSKQRPQQFECVAISKSGNEITVAAGNGNSVFIYRLGPSK